MQIINVTPQLAPKKTLVPLNLDKVLHILLHHVDAQKYSWEQCNKDHKANGWDCAGYNEYITKDGTVVILRGDHIGAQCANYNSKSYGIACEGDYGTDTMPEAQFQSLMERIRYNKARFKNLLGVEPHSKFYPTSCPGRNFPLERIFNELNHVETELEKSVNYVKTHLLDIDPGIWAGKDTAKKAQYVDTLLIKISNELKERGI